VRLEWRRFPEKCVDRLTQIDLTWVKMVFSWEIRKMDMWGDRTFSRSLFSAIKAKCLSHEAADSHANFSQTAVRSSGTLGKGRKLRLTVDGGFPSRLLFSSYLDYKFS
jgi:hypothetical protein